MALLSVAFNFFPLNLILRDYMAKDVNLREIEAKWQEFWLKEGIYSFDENSKKNLFHRHASANSFRANAYRACILILPAGFHCKIQKNDRIQCVLSFWNR